MFNSFVGSIMNMKADVYRQVNGQSDSGAITRRWVYLATINCRVESPTIESSTTRNDNKQFDQGRENHYEENLEVKIKSPLPLSKRYRITAIRTPQDEVVFKELDKFDQPSMTFEVTGAYPEVDPLGRVSYYEATLRRVQVQNNDSDFS